MPQIYNFMPSNLKLQQETSPNASEITEKLIWKITLEDSKIQEFKTSNFDYGNNPELKNCAILEEYWMNGSEFSDLCWIMYS